jgi:hypothetical protein
MTGLTLRRIKDFGREHERLMGRNEEGQRKKEVDIEAGK